MWKLVQEFVFQINNATRQCLVNVAHNLITIWRKAFIHGESEEMKIYLLTLRPDACSVFLCKRRNESWACRTMQAVLQYTDPNLASRRQSLATQRWSFHFSFFSCIPNRLLLDKAFPCGDNMKWVINIWFLWKKKEEKSCLFLSITSLKISLSKMSSHFWQQLWRRNIFGDWTLSFPCVFSLSFFGSFLATCGEGILQVQNRRDAPTQHTQERGHTHTHKNIYNEWSHQNRNGNMFQF